MPTCLHEDFSAQVNVGQMEDTGAFIVDITVRCSQCGEPFRFLGLPSGVSFRSPMVSIDGLELRAPIEPQGEPALFATARFEMPTVPPKH